jgi:hypothetical protein
MKKGGLKNMQKEVELMIPQGRNPEEILLILNSYVKI